MRAHPLPTSPRPWLLFAGLTAALAPAAARAEVAPATPPAAVAPDSTATMSRLEAARRFSFNDPTWPVQLRLSTEIGLAAVVDHKLQQSRDGTLFDYVKEGGQGTAVPFTRVSADLEIYQRHTFTLLYQPIDLRTRSTLTRDVRIEGLTFAAGTPMQYRYGFDFYRFSYLYDFFASRRYELAVGLSLQLRVANIEFASLDGKLQRANQNLGPVPILKVRGRYTFQNSAFLGLEVDGIAIQFPSETGSVFGLLFDASLRAGYSPTNFAEVFLNLRYLGGGAKGPGSRNAYGDGYVDNILHTVIASVGVTIK